MRSKKLLLALLSLQQGAEIGVRAAIPGKGAKSNAESLPSHIEDSYWYDWGIYGPFPRQAYESFGAESPWPNILRQDERCRHPEDGYIFLGPRGRYVPRPGPVMIDNMGDLVWLDTRWEQAMDARVQQYRGEDYITFWTGESTGTGDFGMGKFIMLDQYYDVFRELLPVGDYMGDLHEFRLTDNGTALITLYGAITADLSLSGGPVQGWAYDSLFQEIDIDTGNLLFEWHASEHFAIHNSQQPIRGRGGSQDSAFDFFHINTLDKTSTGDYIISGRYFNVMCIDGQTGVVKWQLGGAENDFTDLSNGAATNFTWNHHVVWYEKDGGTQLTLFDNGATNIVQSAEYSRGLLLDIDVDRKTVRLAQDFVSPFKFSVPSQGSVQILPSGNVLVGWGHTAAWTEFSATGQSLCETHIAPIWFADLGWVKNYRTFKSPWLGRPKTLPDRAMRASEGAIYVSWNGATEVAEWKLQSGSSADGSFVDHLLVPKLGFETRIEVPVDASSYIRVVAQDAQGKPLETSKPVRKDEETRTPVLPGSRKWMLPEPVPLFLMSLAAAMMLCGTLWFFRVKLRRAFKGLTKKGAWGYRYQALPKA